MNKKLLLVLVVFVAVLLGGAAAWWVLAGQGGARAPARVEVAQDRYVGVDKMIVMLRSDSVSSAPHYLAADLVFRTGEDKLAQLKDEIPLLRSIAVRSLSQLDHASARQMSIDDFQQRLALAYRTTFAREGREQPFSAVMFGKLIIE